MGKSVELPKSHIVSTRLNGDEYADFVRLSRMFGGPSEVLRMGLKMLACTVGINLDDLEFGADHDAEM